MEPEDGKKQPGRSLAALLAGFCGTCLHWTHPRCNKAGLRMVMSLLGTGGEVSAAITSYLKMGRPDLASVVLRGACRGLKLALTQGVCGANAMFAAMGGRSVPIDRQLWDAGESGLRRASTGKCQPNLTYACQLTSSLSRRLVCVSNEDPINEWCHGFSKLPRKSIHFISRPSITPSALRHP